MDLMQQARIERLLAILLVTNANPAEEILDVYLSAERQNMTLYLSVKTSDGNVNVSTPQFLQTFRRVLGEEVNMNFSSKFTMAVGSKQDASGHVWIQHDADMIEKYLEKYVKIWQPRTAGEYARVKYLCERFAFTRENRILGSYKDDEIHHIVAGTLSAIFQPLATQSSAGRRTFVQVSHSMVHNGISKVEEPNCSGVELRYSRDEGPENDYDRSFRIKLSEIFGSKNLEPFVFPQFPHGSVYVARIGMRRAAMELNNYATRVALEQ